MIKGLILADTTKKKASLAVKKMNENFFYGNFKVGDVTAIYVSG